MEEVSLPGEPIAVDCLNETPKLSFIECTVQSEIKVSEDQQDCSKTQTRGIGTTCVETTDADRVVERLMRLFRDGHGFCVLVSSKSDKTSINTSSENATNTCNNICRNVSFDPLSILSCTENMDKSSENSCRNSQELKNSSHEKTQVFQSDSISSGPVAAAMCCPSLYDEGLVADTDDSSTVIGMASFFCESVLVEKPHTAVFISFTERDGNSWMDLLYQMPGPTSMPSHLRRYGVRELTLFSQASFHSVNSMREVMELSAKAIQNRPKRNYSSTTSHLLIQVLGVPSDNMVQWSEDLCKLETPARVAVFTQPILYKPILEALGILTPLQESLSDDTFEMDLDISTTSEQTKRTLYAVGGILPVAISVHLLPGLLNGISLPLDKKRNMRHDKGHEVASLQAVRNMQTPLKYGNRPIVGIEYIKHSRRESMCDQVLVAPAVRKRGYGNTSEVNSRSHSCSNTSSTLHLTRRTLGSLQLKDQCKVGLLKPLSPMDETSYARLRLCPSDGKVNFTTGLRALTEYDCRMFGPYVSEQSRVNGSEITARSPVHGRKPSGAHTMLTVPQTLPFFYAKKKLHWEREILLSGELEGRNIIELEEKQHRRVTEAIIENIESNPQQPHCTPHISSLVDKRRLTSPFFTLCRFL
ncbi:hypothetical protein LSM04_008061 [Trypanosoma melophagium]|uniref:uncharacterized protein n=1 Tax=Trypanosoma melophagium TaxID=715481 RepID=UPI00351A87C1|nr:hypothetical protein LSM04_008061 [Trypanosoma melophagium]